MTASRKVVVFLIVGLVVASQSANLVRLGHAHPAAIAAWRLLIATVLLSLLARDRLRQLLRLSLGSWVLLGLAGLALALHFFTWIAAVQQTTVANATTFFTTNPIFTATAGLILFNEKLSWRLGVSIALGLAGVTAIGWPDLRLGTAHVGGDLLALTCSLLFTVYFLLGKRLRRSLDTTVYVTGVYGMAAVFAIIAMFVLELPLVQYDGQTWLCFVLMALGPTMIGHTSMNHALEHIKVGTIATATLIEPPLASLVAMVAWSEPLHANVGVGYALVALSVVVLVLDTTRQAR